MSKLRAFLIHLTISATVVGAVFAIIFFFWYPAPYFRVSGANDIVGPAVGYCPTNGQWGLALRLL